MITWSFSLFLIPVSKLDPKGTTHMIEGFLIVKYWINFRFSIPLTKQTNTNTFLFRGILYRGGQFTVHSNLYRQRIWFHVLCRWPKLMVNWR